MAASCRIELLGRLCIVRDDDIITRFATHKTATLLAYLAYHRESPHSREQLIEMLWPWASPAAGRSSLSTALSSLRHQLETIGTCPGSILLADRNAVRLNQEATTTDVVEFEAALAQAARTNGRARTQRLETAVERYRGSLLPGFHEPWVEAASEHLTEQFIAAVDTLAQILVEEGDTEKAAFHLERATDVAPLREEPYRRLMQLLATSGDPRAAMEVYGRLRSALDRAMRSRPSATTQALARTMETLVGTGPATATVTPWRRRPWTASAESKPPSGLVTFLAIQIAGQKVGRRDPPGDLAAELRRYGGVPLEPGADGAPRLVAFTRAGDALECAAACQLGPAHRTGPSRAPSPRAAMAIHSIEVAPIPHGPYSSRSTGDVLRLIAAASPGQILCSEATASLVRHSLNGGLRLRELGCYRLHGTRGPQRLFQVDYPDGPDALLPLGLESGLESHLPLPITRFFGRERELAAIEATLTGKARLVTLVGAPGCGKTRLSLEVASRLLESCAGRAWFVPLAELRPGGDILDRALDSLGLDRNRGERPLDQIAGLLSGRTALIVFDNFEHLLPAAGQVADLLARLPDTRCVITSRQRLGLPQEIDFVIPPLGLPLTPRIEDLLASESAQLFMDRAQAVHPDFVLTRANAEAVSSICRHLEGIPLAIELAASRVQVLTPAEILSRLAQDEALTSRLRDAEHRHRTLRAAVDWSYRLLPPELQRIFARLSAFHGGWTLDAAETICQDPLVSDHLAQLVDCSLVSLDREAGAEVGRFHMLEMIRQHAREQAGGMGLWPQVQEQHLDYFLTLGLKAASEFTGPQQGAWFDRVAADLDNFIAAIHAPPHPEGGVEKQLRLAGALGKFWDVRNAALGHAVLSELLALDPAPAPTAARASALDTCGLLGSRLGKDSARSQLEAAIAIHREIGDRRALALSLNNLSHTAGDPESARRLLEEALAINQELGNRAAEAANLNNLGSLAIRFGVGDYGSPERNRSLEVARRHFEAGLAIHTELGNKRGMAMTLSNLGNVLVGLSEYDRARATISAGIALLRQLDDKAGELIAYENLATVEIESGNYDQARDPLANLLRVIQELNWLPWAELPMRQAAFVSCRTADGTLGSDVPVQAQEQAVRCLAAAAAMRAHGGSAALDPLAQEDEDRFLAGLQSSLGAAVVRQLWDEGSALSSADAISYVLSTL